VAIFGRVLESEVEVGGAAAVLVSEKEIKSLLAETGGRLTAEESLQLARTILSGGAGWQQLFQSAEGLEHQPTARKPW